MKLMTKDIEKKLLKTETGSTLGNMDAEVIVKYFNPCGAGTWLITEGKKLEDGDWLFHGYCHIFEWEWGAVLLSELENTVCPPYRLKIERDLWCKGCTVQELAA